MAGLLLAPYNDSMRAGQGFNSFLHTQCMHNAVQVGSGEKVSQSSVSQTVSYSSRVVTNVSEIVRSVGISAGSSIKSGAVFLAGNTQSVDTLKFKESHVNVVVSVKVTNQATKLQDDSVFNIPGEDVTDSDIFFDRYGDSYISGFIDGGELHGIILIKVMDDAMVESTTSKIKASLNSSEAGDLILGSGGSANTKLKETLAGTEVTISVSWTGGGQIKPASEPWSLDSLLDAAAAFPAHVAARPHHTWAILTKYSTNAGFLNYALSKGIELPDYANVQSHSADLLDTYIAFKGNLATIQSILENPKAYKISPVLNAIEVNVKALIQERKQTKTQMALIRDEIDVLNIVPEMLEDIEDNSKIESPEVWATRLPILAHSKSSGSDASPLLTIEDFLDGFKITKDPITVVAEEIIKEVPKINPYAGAIKGRFVSAKVANKFSSFTKTYEPETIPEGFLALGHTIDRDQTLVIRAGNDSDAVKQATGFKSWPTEEYWQPVYTDENYQSVTSIYGPRPQDPSKYACIHKKHLFVHSGGMEREIHCEIQGETWFVASPSGDPLRKAGGFWIGTWIMRPTRGGGQDLWAIHKDSIILEGA